MKLTETILLALSAAFLIIGVHQGMKNGIQTSYFFLMVSSGLFLLYTLRKKKALETGKPKQTTVSKPKGKK
ncbi:MAG: hypothetical protein H7282_01345 [Cytophagaceae bacterium]|nr:hypothetical protein [Cytophagaceae bacterium]